MKEKITIVKVGGAVVEDEASLDRLINDFAAIKGRKALVHGGGSSAPKIAALAEVASPMPRCSEW